MTTDFLRGVTDDLHPDVDRLVAGGIARGRARRRRHLAGTAVAAVAVIGVVGAGAVAVPPLLGSAPGEPPVATDPTSPTEAPTEAPTESPTESPMVLSVPPDPNGPPFAVAAKDVPSVVAQLAPGHDVGDPLTTAPYALVDAENEQIVHFRVDGMLTTFVITRASASLAHDCRDEAAVQCRRLEDGTRIQVAAPTTGDGVTMQSTIAMRHRWMVDVMSYNAAEGKDVAPRQPEPALSEDELVTIASNDVWFTD